MKIDDVKYICMLILWKLQVAGSDRSSIILPLSGLKQFHEIVGHFVEITKDRIEGMTGANVRTVDPPQRWRWMLVLGLVIKQINPFCQGCFRATDRCLIRCAIMLSCALLFSSLPLFSHSSLKIIKFLFDQQKFRSCFAKRSFEQGITEKEKKNCSCQLDSVAPRYIILIMLIQDVISFVTVQDICHGYH